MAHTKRFPLGGRELRLAALTLRQLDDLKAEVDLLMSNRGVMVSDPEVRAAAIKVAIASTGGAGEPVTPDFLLDNLDTVSFNDLVIAIFSRNGFLAKEGEQGEVTAAASPT